MARSEAWRVLAPSVVWRERTESGLRVVLDEGFGRQLDALVVSERRCCSWADWTITVEAGHCVLDVTGPAAPMAGLLEALGL